MSLVDDAIAFAARAHTDQRRKFTGHPYIVHPVEVMTILMGVPHTEEMLAAAALHDVVEDCPLYTLNDIRMSFGPVVEKLVEELTEVKVAGNRAVRKAAEVARLAAVSAQAQTIKLADLVSNTKDIVQHDPGFAKVYLKEKRSLLAVLTKGDWRLAGLAHLNLIAGEIAIGQAPE